MAYHSFEKLEVWQRSCRVTVDVFKAFENCRNYTLRDQIQRSSLSVPSNIAEGAERGSKKQFAYFLEIAQGSCGELRTQLYIARKLEFISAEQFEDLINETCEVGAMIRGLSNSLIQD